VLNWEARSFPFYLEENMQVGDEFIDNYGSIMKIIAEHPLSQEYTIEYICSTGNKISQLWGENRIERMLTNKSLHYYNSNQIGPRKSWGIDLASGEEWTTYTPVAKTCSCGAKFTSTPKYHLSYCDLGGK
jgi:hypothetical protein